MISQFEQQGKTLYSPGVPDKAFPIIFLIVFTLLAWHGVSEGRMPSIPVSCSSPSVLETDGHRRLALIVGIDEYKKRNIKKLGGSVSDAKRMYEVLIGKRGYGFDSRNVCLLTNQLATVDMFKKSFHNLLINHAKPGDEVLIYFSGYGSMVKDRNGDEADGYDETLVFHDSRTRGVHDITDDDFHNLLSSLQTKRITVILDASHSGTVLRSNNESVMARFQEPETIPREKTGIDQVGETDGSVSFLSRDIPGLVGLVAADASTTAIEIDGHGVLTDALFTVLSKPPNTSLTYAQMLSDVKVLVSAKSSQIPELQGDISKVFFSNTNGHDAAAFEISQVEPVLRVTGLMLPSLQRGAELRVYGLDSSVTDTLDPKKSKGTIVVRSITGSNAIVGLSVKGPILEEIKRGDVAVLTRAIHHNLRISLRIRTAQMEGGVSPSREAAIRKAILENPEVSSVVNLVAHNEKGALFELSSQSDGRIVLRDATDRIRKMYELNKSEPAEIAKSLWLHARQMVLKGLRGTGGEELRDQETLQVSILPEPKEIQLPCAQEAFWEQVLPNTLQEIPLCARYKVKVELSETARSPLRVAGVFLSSDGAILGLDGMDDPMKPGESRIFSNRISARPPLDVEDQIIVFEIQKQMQGNGGGFIRKLLSRK